MFENIGGKIKGLARAILIIEVIGFVVTAFVLFEGEFLMGVLVAVGGSLVAWISSWFLYAFGELVEDIHAMRNTVCPAENKESDPKPDYAPVVSSRTDSAAEVQPFICPNCNRQVQYGNPKCECGQTFDWSGT